MILYIRYINLGEREFVKIYTIQETAVKMGVGVASVNAMLEMGLLQGIIIDGEVYILPSDYLFEKENSHE